MSGTSFEDWNQSGGPKYPHEKVVQFCAAYPRAQRRHVRALDLGCGSGVHTVFMAGEGFQVSATDLTSSGIRNTQRKLDAAGLQAVVRVESADVLEFPAHSFDLVICMGVFDCTGPVVAKAAVNRLGHVIVSGGRGLFLFASDRDFRVTGEFPFELHGYSRAEVEALFSGGFAEVCIDRCITTYEGGRVEQNDWLVTAVFG